VQLAQAKQNLIVADNGVSLAKSTFNTILRRRDINEPLEVEDILTYTPSPEVLDECIEKANLYRPEIKENVSQDGRSPQTDYPLQKPFLTPVFLFSLITRNR
jgi:hypothetical protein